MSATDRMNQKIIKLACTNAWRLVTTISWKLTGKTTSKRWDSTQGPAKNCSTYLQNFNKCLKGVWARLTRPDSTSKETHKTKQSQLPPNCAGPEAKEFEKAKVDKVMRMNVKIECTIRIGIADSTCLEEGHLSVLLYWIQKHEWRKSQEFVSDTTSGKLSWIFMRNAHVPDARH